MIRDDNTVRRTDLELRCYHIGLETEIYQIEPHHHAIWCKNVHDGFDDLQKYFSYSIRPIGLWIELTQEKPETYTQKLDPISLFDVVDDFKGSYLTRFEIETAIIDRFPDVEICGIHIVEGIDFSITVKVASDTPEEKIKQMQRVLTEIDLGTDQIEVCAETEKSGQKLTSQPLSDVFLLRIDPMLPFTIDEADFWFENATEIYRGDLRRERVPKFSAESSGCFLDRLGSECVDLRSVLLLYETVYLALPLEDEFENFLGKQNLTRNELLQLAECGKVVFVLDNLENRYDTKFLMSAYQCNCFSVIGRRGINSIVAAFLTETRDRFLGHFPKAMEAAAEIYAQAKREGDLKQATIAHLLSWPVLGVASSFRQLNLHGPLGIGMMGLEQLLPPLDKLGKEAMENAQLLFDYVGHTVFTAAALNATLFPAPFSESTVAERQFQFAGGIVSDLLQVYWYDADAIDCIGETRRQTFEEQHKLSLFDCRRNISVTKVVEIADKYRTSEGFMRILKNLEQMDSTEQSRQITKYNDILADLVTTLPADSKLDFILSGSAFLPLPQLLNLIIAAIGVVRGRSSHLAPVRKHAEFKRIENVIRAAGLKENHQFTEDIYMLDKISRIANLK